MNLVSVVIPVYNSKNFVENAISSIQNQSYKNIEIILIDDGSIDESGNLLDRIAAKDNRVVVIHQANGGISAARNRGLEIASGDFIMFCDDDDVYELNCIERLITCINNNNVDLIKYRIKYVILDGNKVTYEDTHGIDDNFVLKNIEDVNLDEYIKLRESKSFVYIWNSLFRSNIINKNGVKFNLKYKFGGEDFDFNYQYLRYSKSVLFIPDKLYTHFKRNGHSTSAKFDDNQIESVYLNYYQETKLLENNKNENIKIYVLTRHFWGLMSVMENIKCPYNLSKVSRVYKQYYNNLITDVIANGKHKCMDLQNSGLNCKRRIIMMLLEYHQYSVVAFISLCYRKIKICKEKRNEINDVI